jgi:hypothetical protein
MDHFGKIYGNMQSQSNIMNRVFNQQEPVSSPSDKNE